jgi:diacylglycerol kinase family enzyme
MGLYIMAVANGRYLGGNMHIAPKAQISDGQVRKHCHSLYSHLRPGRFFILFSSCTDYW